MEKSLQLVFKNAAGTTKIITISNPKENLSKAETDAAMQKIVTANVFSTVGGDLVPVSYTHLTLPTICSV